MISESTIAYAQEESERIAKKWGDQSKLPDLMALSVLVEEVGEVAMAMNDCEGDDNLHAELIQVATVALRWADRVGRRFQEDY